MFSGEPLREHGLQVEFSGHWIHHRIENGAGEKDNGPGIGVIVVCWQLHPVHPIADNARETYTWELREH